MDFRDRLGFRLEALAAETFVFFLALLPIPAGRAFGRFLGRLWGLAVPSRRRLARENLRAAFPDAPESDIRRWEKEIWPHLGQVGYYTAKLANVDPQTFFDLVDVQGIDLLRASSEKGKGVLTFTAHYGNWEYAAHVVSLSELRFAMIARRMKNPWVNDLITRLRERLGGEVILHKNAARESLRVLRQGRLLGVLFDQRITAGGTYVPFFGRPAATTTLPAVLALRLGCPVHPIHTRWERGKWRVTIEPALPIEEMPPTKENLVKLMAQMTAVIERWIREDPSQYMWIHNRWRP